MLLIDAHLDLSLNAMQWNRDLTLPLQEMREQEAGQLDRKGRGHATITFPEMRRAEIGICVATQIGHSAAKQTVLRGYASPEIAWAQTQGQLAFYRAMEIAGEMVQITDLDGLRKQLARWQNEPHENLPIGYILSLEGADSIVNLDYLDRAYESGLRALGPAHYGPGRYAPGTGCEGGLEPCGRELVKKMDELGIILDVTHLTDDGFWEALDIYHGPVWASHHNCRALVPGDRQLNDDQIKKLIERDAVIGAAFDAWMIHPGWLRGTVMPQEVGVKMAHIVDHIDHICQLAGNARHCAIGTDLDGGFGTEQTPMDVHTIADVPKMAGILEERGYSSEDIQGIFHGNWLRFLEQAWG